jgi:HK97 family phage major capsid protein/HK97 family phage prohead protease
MPTQTRKIKCDKPLQRSFVLNRESVNQDERTVELSFSSETRDVERWFGIEILDHNPKSVRLDRMRANGPLLFNHDWDIHLGAVNDIRIEQKKGKAVVRFGNSDVASEKFRDVQDGILTAVSFAYRVHKLVLEEEVDGGPNIYRATDWEPLEISLVTVPADISVGVGRSAGESFEIEIEDRTMPKLDENGAPVDENRGAPAKPQPVVADRAAIENEVRAAEQKRVADLLDMGKRHATLGGEELAREAIAKGHTLDQMRAAILARLPSADDVGTRGTPPADTRLDLSANDLRNYSLMRAISAVVAARNGDSKAMAAAAFEMECSRELGERMDREARGFFVPLDVVTRGMNATANADFIGTQHMGDMFIDTLRPRSVVMQLGATVMDGLDGNLELPKALSNPIFTWVGDDEDAGLTNMDTGLIKMAPKTLAGGVPMSRRLLKQSSPSVERVVHNALLKGAALGIDYGILAGTGTNNQPLGVFNMAGVNTQSVSSAGAPTWAELVGFETAVAADNALEGKLAYVTTSGVRGNLKTTKKDAGSGIFLMDGENANGHPVAVSNQLAANKIAFGNWEDVMVGLWGVIDVNPDLATKAGSGGLILRVFQDADVAIGHAESFCINS